MSDTHDDRRKSVRRQRIRRSYDALQGKATEEERLQHDMLMLSINRDGNKRLQKRRTGEDRREDGGAAVPVE